MHKEILSKEQVRLLPLVANFRKDFYLAGGTAIALHIGHRRSIDFDLFSNKKIQRIKIKNTISRHGNKIEKLLYEEEGQIHLIVDSVKLTFYQYPYQVSAPLKFENIIYLPDLIDLAAMKALAFGGRAKWKDYVDMYFLLKFHFSFEQISIRAKELYCEHFNEKLFRQQLCYFKDIDYQEAIEFMPGKETGSTHIKDFLVSKATENI